VLKLFDISYKIIQDPFLIVSPLGNVVPEVYFDDLRLSKFLPAVIGQVSDDAFIYIWDFNNVHLELLRISIVPELPQHLKVEKCIALLWRFKNLSKKINLRLKCQFFPKRNAEWDSESGECLSAQCWEDADYKITIGTQDEECLEGRAFNSKGLPLRLAKQKLLDPELVENHEDGIEVVLPPLLENEEGQIQFIISWVNKKETDPISTWYAVDQKPEYILKSIDVS